MSDEPEEDRKLRKMYPTEKILMKKAKWLEGKTLNHITDSIQKTDKSSRVLTKGKVGNFIEHDYFDIKINSDARPDIPHLGIEIKTCPLKFDKTGKKLSVKEPLSLNMINYMEEWKCKDITESSLYRKNKRVLFVFYIHDKRKKRSQYVVKYVFLWEMDDNVLDELRPDYKIIIDKIKAGKATDLHQKYNEYLTTCPKHNGKFKDPTEMTSKTKQPFSEEWAERKAFRLKNKYMDLIVSRHLGKPLGKGGWSIN